MCGSLCKQEGAETERQSRETETETETEKDRTVRDSVATRGREWTRVCARMPAARAPVCTCEERAGGRVPGCES